MESLGNTIGLWSAIDFIVGHRRPILVVSVISKAFIWWILRLRIRILTIRGTQSIRSVPRLVLVRISPAPIPSRLSSIPLPVVLRRILKVLIELLFGDSPKCHPHLLLVHVPVTVDIHPSDELTGLLLGYFSIDSCDLI